MADIIKRLRYFDHQFLQVGDFREEQDYHLQMRRRHNRWLHTWGVAGGLKLEAPAGAAQVEVTSGLAVDEDGREIVLLTGRTLDLPSGAEGGTLFVTLHLEEQETDHTDEAGALEARRVTERPVLLFSPTAPEAPGRRLILGRVLLDAAGRVASTDEGVGEARRHYAGFVGGDLEVRALWLTEEGHDAGDWPVLRWGASNRADLTGSLRVSDDVDVAGTLDVDGAVSIGGNAAVSGTLSVTTTSMLMGKVNTGDLQVESNATVVGTLSVSGASTLSGRVTTGNDLHVESNATVAGTLSVTGASTLTGDATLSGTLRVEGTTWVPKLGVGIGTAEPVVALQLPEQGLQIGASTTVGRNFHFVSDEVGGSTRALRLYNGNYGSGTHLLTFTGAGRLGVGTTTPRAALEVAGAIMPAAGNSAEAGIFFPQDPGGGLGDAAWIRYYPRAGTENTVFEIGTANDAGDTLALITPGGVGINIHEPLTSLHIPRNGLQIGTSGNYWENFHLVSNEVELTTGLRLYNGNYGSGTHLLTITQSGALGLGKNKPASMFHLAPSNGYAIATLEGDASTTLQLEFIDRTNGNRRHRLNVHNWRGQFSVDYTTPNGNTSNHFYVRSDGEMRVNSIRSKNGAKVGYVVDHFINAVGATVEQGDVVVFAGSAPEQFWSTAGDIPIPEVDLAAKAYDTRVCGIVAQVLTEDQLPWVEGAPDDTGLEARIEALRQGDQAWGEAGDALRVTDKGSARAGSRETRETPEHPLRRFAGQAGEAGEAGDALRVEDEGSARARTREKPREMPEHPLRRFAGQADEDGGRAHVGPGQMGSMVTLGAYAYCKVDADIAPIQVGDLLTTSPTPGHAQKATDPAKAAGSVLGKAMAPLGKGKGRIAVLVSLQ